MIAASVKGDVHQDGLDRASGIVDSEEEDSSRTIETRQQTRNQARRHSGLSALIQAATVQLGQLAEVASAQIENDNGSRGKSTLDEEHGEHPSEKTPDLVPKPDPNRQSFPELLMTLAVDPSNIDVITFLPDGKFFAIRSKQFSEEVMIHYFAVTTFEEFIELSNDWGFSRILQDNNCTGIEVFRHPLFIRCNWEKCTHIKFGESPTDARVSALPEQAKICMPEDSKKKPCGSSTGTPLTSPASTKRRLSPGFLARRNSESSIPPKHRVVIRDPPEVPSLAPPKLIDRHRSDSDGNESLLANSYSQVSQTDEIRSVALAITTEKMKLKNEKTDAGSSTPLVEEAVESCTHTIVTDAIETLLRDESHTKETYLKHQDELGRSSFPGVVPITKQLFSESKDSEGSNDKQSTSLPKEVTTKRPSVSPPTLEEAKSQGDVTSSLEASPETSPTLKPAEASEPSDE